jgi:hypothetical protein
VVKSHPTGRAVNDEGSPSGMRLPSVRPGAGRRRPDQSAMQHGVRAFLAPLPLELGERSEGRGEMVASSVEGPAHLPTGSGRGGRELRDDVRPGERAAVPGANDRRT